ncbi:MAG TPA: NosD domain-containing protein [Ramlibacter sp.]
MAEMDAPQRLSALRKAATLAGVLMLSLAGAAIAQPGAATGRPHSAMVASAQPDTCSRPKEVSGLVELQPGCVYRQDFVIATSDSTLDCKGAVIDGENRLELGVLVDSRGKPLANVQVRNCVIRNITRQAVRVAWQRSDTDKPKDPVQRAEGTPSRVRLTNLDISGTGSVGVYFDDYVRDSVLENSRVTGSGGTAVYLEFATRNIEVRNNVFEGNGLAKKREGLAIDASSNNKVVGNTFINNAAGGIFLYKNCGEEFSRGRSPLRTTRADDNLLANNRFVNEKVGIWIASRQSRNLVKWDCGDAPMDRNRSFYQDFADRNVVEGNVFCGAGTAVRIEGDDNQVRGNFFDRRVRSRVEIPVSKRGELLGRPPTGNRHDQGQDAGQRCS